MVVEQNPNHIWSIVQVHLPSRNARATIIGAVVGAASMSSFYFFQVAFGNVNQAPPPRFNLFGYLLEVAFGDYAPFWGMVLIGAAGGALIGNVLSVYRKRNCPKCGLSMGAAQNINLDGWDRASPANQLDLREWVGGRGKHHIEPFYLCKSCDLEFRLADLERREATCEAASTQSDRSTWRSRDKPVARENGPSDRAEESESSTPEGLQIELETLVEYSSAADSFFEELGEDAAKKRRVR